MKYLFSAAMVFLFAVTTTLGKEFRVSDYGLNPNTRQNASPIIARMVDDIKQYNGLAVVVFEKGRYDFFTDSASVRQYYISNHDQDNPKIVGLSLENLRNITIDGNGADFIFHGRMLPLAVVQSTNVTIKNLSVDFEKPHIAQAQIIENDTAAKIIKYRVAPWVDFVIRDNKFINKGPGWENEITGAMAFEPDTRRIVYRSSDIWYGQPNTKILADNLIQVHWDNPLLTPGTIITLRSWYRPAPAIFVDQSKNTILQNVTVHYAEGMGLLAQLSENITLKHFNVALRGPQDPRYFTTQADATHFSGCRGKIISTDGLYENMMDDAINIHGTYLKITKRSSNNTVQARYMHPQAYGFLWGEAGDKVQFVLSNTMEITGAQNKIASIKPLDKPSIQGAKLFEITFEKPLDPSVNENCGIENLTWTPSVLFARNTIRNNRARGALFSTPQRTVVEDNLFDHTSGTAILLCGDCNGWFETGACRQVVIRKNRFVNALTSMFQFTNAVISIYPEIPNLDAQKKHFHGGRKNAILIEDNVFEMFDTPIVYAKSVDGLTFRRNTILRNNQYPAFHPNQEPFKLERVVNAVITE